MISPERHEKGVGIIAYFSPKSNNYLRFLFLFYFPAQKTTPAAKSAGVVVLLTGDSV